MSQATLGSTPYRNSSLFSGYYLDERINDLEEWECNDEAQGAFEALQQLWDLEGELVRSYKEDELLDSWIDEVLDILGFGTLSEPTLPNSGGYNDRLLFESDEKRRDAAKRKRDGETEAMYGLSSAVLEAKQWDADFTKRFNEQRSYRDASHQIKYYLEHTPERLKWGILTDGKKWRLYGTKDYATEIYYEVDLPELLESGDLEQFKYFYTFFRPAAFREVAGTSFLDTVWNESETAAQELGEDLQDNVFTALRVLGEGFIHTNDLDIDPDDEDARAELKEQSLVLLYRLMFILYAESRGLIHPDDPEAQAEFEEHFSLDQIRLDIHEAITSGDSYDDYSGYATQIWGQLQDLFGLVDEGKEALEIPPYNGGLFDDESHQFLAENEVADRYIAEVIHRLGTTEGEDGNPVLADYADLDTRHLGSIYEGLLEHEFRIAGEPYAAVSEDGGQVWKPGTEVSVADAVETVEKGELYVVNDDGERKATGAYYTPDYVVSYIVEETVDPLLEDIKSELESDGLEPSDTAYFRRFWQQVLDLKILDPAMGSAHFLTSATGYLTEQVMEVVREQEIQSYDEQELRRTIAKECIYGVDVNGMAVELGKLSMWLETLAADKPLAFLDHHLKAGNSLVGSDISEVLSDDTEENGGQLTLTQAFARARQQTLEHVMDLMEDLMAIDNDDLADIKSMEEIYDEIRADPLYQRLFEIANVHTAEEFGLDVPEGVYEEMAGAIEDADGWGEIQDEDWFRSAQAMSEEEDFFHWELEFPEVFFGADGERLEGAGFDAVVGNPPYLLLQGTEHQEVMKAMYEEVFTGSNDIAHFFIQKGINLLKEKQRLGFVVTRYWLESDRSDALRKYIANHAPPNTILDFGNLQIWPEVNVLAVIAIFEKREHEIADIYLADEKEYSSARRFLRSTKTGESEAIQAKIPRLDEKPWNLRALSADSLWKKVRQKSTTLNRVSDITQGIKTGNNEAFTVTKSAVEKESIETEALLPLARSKDIRRFNISTDRYLIYADDDFEIDEYPGIRRRLNKYQSNLEDRAEAKQGKYPWWRLQRPRDRELIRAQKKLLVPHYARKNRFAFTDDSAIGTTDTFLVVPETDYEVEYLSAILNSKLMNAYMSVFGKQKRAGYISFAGNRLKKIPVLKSEKASGKIDDYQIAAEDLAIDENIESKDPTEVLKQASLLITEHIEKQNDLNLDLLDYLGTYDDGPTIANIGLTQPSQGSADSILQETTKEKPNLRAGEVTVVREADTTVEIRLTARYKPDDEDDYETDQWGYTETDPLPALRITDLSETEADLIEAFVPVAVDEAGGFADFREKATQTNSLVDRLRKLTLPAVDDVQDGLESYIETKERAEELEEKIERTDDLIDEIVYELYGLTDEEIEIVEEAVGG